LRIHERDQHDSHYRADSNPRDSQNAPHQDSFRVKPDDLRIAQYGRVPGSEQPAIEQPRVADLYW
jgi:hypothetical protein